MIETIRIGHLLRETATSPYRHLVTRPTGAAVRNRIEAALSRSDCLTALLDFSDIELLDFSCAEEIVAKLLLAQAAQRPRFVVLRGLRDDQHDAIEQVLTHHRLAARAAFACICRLGRACADDLVRSLDWPEPRATEALETLTHHRLVRPEGDLRYPLLVA
jgi:predicted alpha/beta-fold hydrolase